MKPLVGLAHTPIQILLCLFIFKLKSRNSKTKSLLVIDIVNFILPDVSMVFLNLKTL